MTYSFSAFEERLQASLQHTHSEIKKLRTGRATVSMLDDVFVEAYGARMRIAEVASISTPDATLLVISPWDKSLVEAIEKAIQAADLNLHPVVDGQIVRIAVPSLTEENRQLLVKKLHQYIEAGRVAVRSARSDTKRQIEEQKGNSGVSEDDIASSVEQLETKVRTVLDELEVVVQKKEHELLTL
ncbi:MAG: ribosome recycling factor [Candidatus Pacebacteria bacterium RIFCSPHIGHO2_01_FULL_46_16]|nr:MAG: ribosome recycling factor [Candidatus Pacebacteria bacterium RIFCSPHIGHO2_01_FULL_46_16]OGJ21794.1 MAG: ribosome recycling factor [Candidatus Pacebacteria bacterium RIFCSPHIGHO2_02_FULL_46_9]